MIASTSISSNIVPFVFDFLARDGFELRHQFGDAFAAVRFDDADDDVLAAAVAADRFAQHAVRLADAGRVAEKQLQHALRFFRGRGDCQPLFRRLRHGFILFYRRPESYDRMAPCAYAFCIRILQFPAALGIVLGIALLYHKVLPVNATTVALTFLLAILAVSTVWGMAVSVVMSVGGDAGVQLFLPAAGGQRSRSPTRENWVALLAFLAVAVISSHLSTRARQQAADASARQRDVEKLYSFSQGLLESRNVMELVNRIPGQIVRAFEVGAAALFLADKQKVYRSGPVVPQLDTETLKTILARDEPVIDVVNSVCFLPVRMGVHPVGSLGISGTRAFAADARSHRDSDRDRHGARPRRRASGTNGSCARSGKASHRAARCGHARAAHAAHLHQSLRDEFDLEPQPRLRPEAGTAHDHQ